MKLRIMSALVAAAALSATAGTAVAAPKDVAYSYPYVTLVDTVEPNRSGTFIVTGGVHYTAKTGGPVTYCNYYELAGPTAPVSTAKPEGYYNVASTTVLSDTSSESVRQYCVSHFSDRTRIQPDPYPVPA